MGKESKERRQFNPMDQAKQQLEAKNVEVGGRLFATFGKGKSKVLIFPTPHTIQEGGVPIADELLVVTNDSYRAIHFDRGQEGISVKSISDIVEGSLGSKYGFFSRRAGYADGELILDGSLYISSKRASDFRHTDLFSDEGPRKVYKNCGLIKVDRTRVEEILNANLERVESTRVTSQRVSNVLRGTNS